ncbi:MAG: hypothetical protein OQK79_03660 [Rhodanobacter sp.]|jgi:hypothetical protein|nr:hypothetical protein [Rhodanobacter sp.]
MKLTLFQLRAVVTPIAPLCEHAIELPHPFRQTDIRRRDHQMVVMAHQAVRMAAPIELPDHLTENFQKMLAVRVTLIDRLTAITTRRHMVNRTTEFEASGSGHAADPIPTNATMLDLTPRSSFTFAKAAPF